MCLNTPNVSEHVCVCVSEHPYLHGEGVGMRGHALQGLVRTAATAAAHGHAGGQEEVVRLLRELPPHVHQHLPRLTAAALVHLHPLHHWRGEHREPEGRRRERERVRVEWYRV